MRPGTQLVERSRFRVRRIAHQAQDCAWPVVVLAKPVGLEIERQCDQGEKMIAKSPHGGLVGNHLRAKFRDTAGPLVVADAANPPPCKGVVVGDIHPAVIAFLEVGRGGLARRVLAVELLFGDGFITCGGW